MAVVMAQANHSRTDIMKSTIQAEAEKAAKKIREALEEFNRVTGLTAEVQASWVYSYRLSEVMPDVVLDRVEVQPVLPCVRV